MKEEKDPSTSTKVRRWTKSEDNTLKEAVNNNLHVDGETTSATVPHKAKTKSNPKSKQHRDIVLDWVTIAQVDMNEARTAKECKDRYEQVRLCAGG